MNTGPARPRSAPHRAAPAPRTRITFWGVRGSIPTPGPATTRFGGNTSCVEVRIGDQIIILDAGTGLRPLGQQLALESNRRPLDVTLLLTHTHWDHIQGLPFFAPVYQPGNRLRILGYKGARQGLQHILSGQMENPFFPIGLSDVPANVRIEELDDLEFKLGKVRVQACLANHPGVCVGYRIFAPQGSVAFFPDNECHRAHHGFGRRQRTQLGALNGSSSLIEFVRGVDVLIMDAQYDRAEYRHHIGWGHGCLDDVVRLALLAGVKRLFLFHHDPDHNDAKVARMAAHGQKLAAAAKGRLRVEAAREGQTVELT